MTITNKKYTKIIYVEDEEDIREIVIASLEYFGNFEIVACSNGSEALSICQKFHPDVLLLDVMMPGMDGPATLMELRKFAHLKEVPAIFITAKVQPHELKEYSHVGTVGIIKKPFEVTELADTINRYIHENSMKH
jgi:two-component system OmpR family response regulator